MKSTEPKNKMQLRAAEALKHVLSGMSSTKLKEIRQEQPAKCSRVVLAAVVDVFSRRHTLACEVTSSASPAKLRVALEELRKDAREIAADAMPVLIARHLSPEAQELCKSCGAGFLDLQGNARIGLGEVFIGKRSMPIRAPKRVAVHPALFQQATSHAKIHGHLVPANLPHASAPVHGDATAGIAVA
jgi:hypothetical protein